MMVKIKLKQRGIGIKEREIDSRVTSCKNSHPRLNKQGCKWENDDTILLHKIK